MSLDLVQKWALRYAANGWRVFPLRANDKAPATKHGFKDATEDPEAIRKMFPPGTKYNLGGVVPEGCIAVDVDPGGLDALRALDYDLPATATQRTPRGGTHHLFGLPEGVAGRQDNSGDLCPNVDTRAEGKGYLVLAPSTVDGTAYAWEVQPKPDHIAPAPDWLVDWCRAGMNGNGHGSPAPARERSPNPVHLDLINAAIHERGAKPSGGDEVVISCLEPEHEDAHPSACWNVAKGTGTCYKCGVGWSLRRAAELLGVDLPAVPGADGEELTHDALALAMGAQWTDARHVALWGRWMFYDGSRWAEDATLQHMTRTREYLRERAEELIEDAERRAEHSQQGQQILDAATRSAKVLRNAHTVAQVASLARSNPEQATTVDVWDADPWLLGCPGVTVDLRTGETYEPRAEDHITKSTAVAPAAPGARPELWLRVVERMSGGDGDLIDYHQRLAGYCLTGIVDEHVMEFAYGKGANSKSVYTGAQLGIMGDYGCTVPTDMLMVSRTDRHPTEIARLRGVRLAVGSEVEVGRTWAESKVKSLTGGDRLQGRYMRQDFFEFDPQFKLVVVGNHRPSLRGVDEAIRRRLHLVPFTVTIPRAERDKDLPRKLRAEWPAILRWMIDGCLEWQRRGLDPPESVVEATKDYLTDEDAIGRWLEERCEVAPHAWASAADLYRSYQTWGEATGEYVLSQKRLGQELADRGFEPFKSGLRGYRGVKLLEVKQCL